MFQIQAKGGVIPTGTITCAESFGDVRVPSVQINADDFEIPEGKIGFRPPCGVIDVPVFGPLELEEGDKVIILQLSHTRKSGFQAEVSSYIITPDDSTPNDGKGNRTSRPQQPRYTAPTAGNIKTFL